MLNTFKNVYGAKSKVAISFPFSTLLFCNEIEVTQVHGYTSRDFKPSLVSCCKQSVTKSFFTFKTEETQFGILC